MENTEISEKRKRESPAISLRLIKGAKKAGREREFAQQMREWQAKNTEDSQTIKGVF